MLPFDHELVQSALDRQRTEWGKGNRVRPEVCASAAMEESTKRELLLELIHAEVVLREESGELPTLAEYQQRYPEFADELRIQWELDLMMMAEADCLDEEISADVRHIGRYELQRVLGRGGMGIVYLGWDPKLKRRVAIKRIREGLDASDQDKNRLRTEAEAISRIEHQNIVRVYDIGQIGDLPYFAMEYCDSGSLANLLDGVPLPILDAVTMIEKIARAVAVTHQHQVIHRDIKPSNVLLSLRCESQPDSVQLEPIRSVEFEHRPHNRSELRKRLKELEPKVSDFGLARMLDHSLEQTKSGMAMGTPSYMSPEIARGRKAEIGPATDIYSLGALLYECLTGRPPFLAESVHGTIRQVLEDEPVPPAQLNRSIPRDLDNIVMMCLEKQAVRRYPSAVALADDLERFLNGMPVMARPIPVMTRSARWVKRNPAISAALGALLIATLVFHVLRERYLNDIRESRNSAVSARKSSDENAQRAEQNFLLAQQNAEQATQLRQEAERQLARAEKNSMWAMESVDALLQKVSDQSLNSIPGMVLVRQQILEEALLQCDKFLQDRGVTDRVARLSRLMALQRAGRIHRLMKQDETSEAEYKEAKEICQTLTEEFPDEVRFAEELAKSTYQLSLSIKAPKRSAENFAVLDESLKLWDEALVRFANHPSLLLGKVKSMTALGPRHRVAGNIQLAESMYRDSLQILSELMTASPDDVELIRTETTTVGNLAALLIQTSRAEEALAMQERAVRSSTRMAELVPGDLPAIRQQLLMLKNLSAIKARMPGMEEQALREFETLITVAQKVAKDQPLIEDFQVNLADALVSAAILYRQTGDFSASLDSARRAGDVLEPIAAKHPAGPPRIFCLVRPTA